MEEENVEKKESFMVIYEPTVVKYGLDMKKGEKYCFEVDEVKDGKIYLNLVKI